MRAALPSACVLVLAAAASPACAQSSASRQQLNLQSQIELLRAQQDFAARQQIIQQNELSRMDAQMRTRQAFETLQAQSVSPQIPPPPASGAMPQIDVSGLASIPDDKLAASNARIRAVAGNRP